MNIESPAFRAKTDLKLWTEENHPTNRRTTQTQIHSHSHRLRKQRIHPIPDIMSSTNAANETSTAPQPNHKPRKLGRAARRRKSKTRSIHLALQALIRGEPIDEQDHSLLPTDRSQSLPGVIQRRQENQIEFDKDEPLLVAQLGYMPGNAIGVVGRVKHLESLYPSLYKLLQKIDGKGNANGPDLTGPSPTSLKLYPLAVRNVFKGGKSGRKFKSRKRGHDEISQSDEKQDSPQDEQSPPATATENETNTLIEPFPTMYWLTHPFLRTLISHLELGSTDNVIQIQEKLSSSPEYLSRMKASHESYGKHRWELLTEQDKKNVRERKWTEAVGSVRGVAGIRKYETVKCLHTHSAHYLAFLGNTVDDENGRMEENLVGKWVLEAVEKAVREMKDDDSEEEQI